MPKRQKKSAKKSPKKPRARRRFLTFRACPKCGSKEVTRSPSWAVKSGEVLMCMDCRFVWHAK